MQNCCDSAHLLLEHVEVVNDDSDEQVQCEEGPADDEDDKVEVVVERGLPVRLLVDLARVDGVGHHLHPALEGGHLRRREIRQIFYYLWPVHGPLPGRGRGRRARRGRR